MEFFDEVLVPSLKDGADVEVLKNSLSDYVSKQNEEFTAGLRQNRDQILDEKKSLSDKLRSYEDQYAFLEGKEFTADSYNNLMSELETYKASATKEEDAIKERLSEQYNAGKRAYEESIAPTLNSLKLKLEETEKSRDQYLSQYKNYLKDNALRGALSEMHVEADEFWIEGLKNSSRVEYSEEGGIKNIFIKHDGSEYPIQDWKKVFPTTERGKKMIKVLPNMGGAGHGSKGGSGENMSLEEINNIADPRQRQAELAKYMKTHK